MDSTGLTDQSHGVNEKMVKSSSFERDLLCLAPGVGVFFLNPKRMSSDADLK